MIKYFIILFLSGVFSCFSCISKKEKGEKLYRTYCTTCHITPSIADLPKDIWLQSILPEMGYRLGIRDTSYDPLEGMTFKEMEAVYESGVYPGKQQISLKEWETLKEYVLAKAPEKLAEPPAKFNLGKMNQFIAHEISLDSSKGAFITYLDYDDKNERIIFGDVSGNLSSYDPLNKVSTYIGFFRSGITDYIKKEHISYVTAVGNLDPSEQRSGSILIIENDSVKRIPENYHRPVNLLIRDLDKNGQDELILSEYGHLTGKLSLLVKKGELDYERKILLNKPGTIRVLANDMDGNGLDDLIILSAQGDESIYIFFQEELLKFRIEQVFRFSPVYGCSWFEMVDYDDDGDEDLIVANGDNMDKSYVSKPYHGVRILLNDGNNNFEEKSFIPLNGATRFVANDFDQDGDIDMGVVCSFPDYEKYPEYSFVYLENENSKSFLFKKCIFDQSKKARWFLIDSGDVDQDNDEDIIISAFSYAITPEVNEELERQFQNDIDIMILENQLLSKDPHLSKSK